MTLFVMLDAHQPWRRVMLSEHRTGLEFALCMRALVDEHYPHAQRIRVVLDNLSTHTPAALYQSFPAPEARRILRRLEFHYTPKHASWLNMVEIEIGVLKGQCLDRRISEPEVLKAEITAWERARNSAGARIHWMFTTEKARAKMGRAYPQPASPMDRSNRHNLCEKVLAKGLPLALLRNVRSRKLLMERRCCTDLLRLPARARSVQGGTPQTTGNPAVPFKHHAEHRHHIPKPRYRVTNGPEYDAALRRRGSLTVWFTDEAIAAWRRNPAPHRAASRIIRLWRSPRR
jgi:hypothetical protein